jgi:hypothetical protein
MPPNFKGHMLKRDDTMQRKCMICGRRLDQSVGVVEPFVAALGAGCAGHGISRPSWRAQPPMARYSGSGASDSITDGHTSLQHVVRV